MSTKTAEPPPPKGVSVTAWDKILSKGPSKPRKTVKTAAPIALIRKLADAREDQVDRDLERKTKAYHKAIVPGALVGGLGGGALGVAGSLALGHPRMMEPAFYAGAIGGGTLGAALGGGKKGRALKGQVEVLRGEKDQLSSRMPDSEGPLTDENLDRDRYQGLRADLAQNALDLQEHTKPVRQGAVLGGLAGGGIGAYFGRHPVDRAVLGAGGAAYGALLGAGGGVMLNHKQIGEATLERQKLQEERNRIWRGAATLDDQAPVEEVRKAAQAIAFEAYLNPPLSTEDVIWERKLASVDDAELFKSAAVVSDDLDEAFQTYESLGGTYKHAFGAQMFDSKQMAGSPAVSQGMTNRAATAPGPQQPGAPGAQSVAAVGQPRVQGTSAPSATSMTSAPSAPTG